MTREQMVASLNELMRRYIADPSEFETEFQTIDRFREESSGDMPSYGETVVQYLERLAEIEAPSVAHGAALLVGEPVVSLRDHFAGLALQAIIAKYPPHSGGRLCDSDISMARGAYDYADAMLQVRDRG